MKALVASILFLFSVSASSKAFFQPRLGHEGGHELVWTFDKAPEGWGKTDLTQVQLECKGEPAPWEIKWSNGTTLKLVFFENLRPGMSCKVRLNLPAHKDRSQFKVPLVKVSNVYPWEFEKLDEDAVFILELEAPVDPAQLANDSYVEVEGLSEPVELDLVSGDLRKAVLKAQWLDDDPRYVVLSPRRHFPVQKSVVLVVPEGQTFEFKKQGKIRDPFRATMTCERGNADAPCSPLGRVSLEFSSQVRYEDLKDIRLTQGKNSFILDLPEGEGITTYATFKARLEAETSYEITVPEDLRDADGRSLSNAGKFPLKFTTGPFPPLAKFPGPFGILEAAIKPILPVTVRNVEKEVRLQNSSAVLKLSDPLLIMQWRRAIERRQHPGYGDEELRGKSVFAGSAIKLQQEKLTYGALKNQLEVLGLPLGQKGLHLVELSSDAIGESLLPSKEKFFVSTAVLVTDLVAHLKVSEQNALVWVTDLGKGTPVAQVEVKAFDCQGKILDKGKTNEAGVVIFKKVSKDDLQCTSKVESFSGKLMVIASKGDDITFTLSDWNEGIEPWRFGIPWYDSGEDLRSHTVFDRPIYKVGETVHMLHLLRRQQDQGLAIPKPIFTHLRIHHQETNKDWRLPLRWRDGRSTSNFPIPENAPQGSFYLTLVKLNDKGQIDQSIEAGVFRVKEFRIPLMRSELHFQDKREAFRSGDSLALLGHLEFLAGGPSSDTPVTLRGEVSPVDWLHVPEWEGYSFNLGKADASRQRSGTLLEKKKVTTDKNGDFVFNLTDVPKSDIAQTLSTEIEYRDPSGVFQTNGLSVTIYPSSFLIGIKPPGETFVGKKADFKILLIDHSKKALPGKPFTGRLFRSITSTTRKKILGGFYTYDNTYRFEDLGEVCEGVTKKDGLATCSLATKTGGSYYLQVESQGSVSHLAFWVYGDTYAWGSQSYNDRMDLIADKKEYDAGDVARIELKPPFETGTVLVTKERKGINDSWVLPFSRKSPFIEVPLEKDDYPNTFVSAFVVRGRLGEAQATGLVDLGKPSHRLGLIELKVNSDAHELRLSITPSKETYQVRDKVSVRLRVTDSEGKPVKNAKVALTAYDEGLLLFSTKDSFNALASLIRSHSHGVITATAQTHVIGKRHMGLKAKPQGGGGGRDQKPRELFDTLLFWNPEISLNEKGEAQVEFKLNDSITAFKLQGLAYTTERLGQSRSRIKATQDVMTFVGTAPVVRTGDEFFASYLLKNLTSTDKKLDLVLSMEGKTLEKGSLELSAGKSGNFIVPVKPFSEARKVTYSLEVREGKKKLDELRTSQLVVPLTLPEVRFADLKAVDPKVQIEAPPQENLSHVELLLSGSLLPSNEPLREYMRGYAYSCLEQLIAKAVILEDDALKKRIERELPTYLDKRGFLKFYPAESEIGSLLLTAHFLEVAHWSEWKISRGTELEAALGRFVRGETRDLLAWEAQNYELLRQRAMVALKIRGSKEFNPSWMREVTPPSESDTRSDLLTKWALFHPAAEAKKAQEFLRHKLKIDGAQVRLSSEAVPSFMAFLSTAPASFARFLLLQKTLPLKGPFDEFYRQNEGKFVRGFIALRRGGHYGVTLSNTLAFILEKKWSKKEVSGVTRIAGQEKKWQGEEGPRFILEKEAAASPQTLVHQGKGSPWADVRFLYWPNVKEARSQGISLAQKMAKVDGSGSYRVQDRVELTVTIENKDEQTLLGIRIPIPAGSTILDAEMLGQSFLSFEERSESEWRGYFNLLPKGKHVLKLIFRLNHAGAFGVPGSRIEALYSPEVYGVLPHWSLDIGE